MSDFPLDRTETRENFAHFLEIPTRWGDNDQYGHVNNAKYHTYFEMLSMHYLEVVSGLDCGSGAVKPYTVENLCRYHASLAFPDIVEAGLRIGRLGNSSARYEIGLFAKGREPICATGYFVDVFVDAASERPTAIPAEFRAALERLIVA